MHGWRRSRFCGLHPDILFWTSSSFISTSMSADKCPVDHSSLSASGSKAESCPVDHPTRSTWSSIFGSSSPSSQPQTHASSQAATPPPTGPTSSLSTARETSTIPRNESGERWVYPSEAQFFAAMARKNHNPQAPDMRVIVPIHNAVNERAWGEILGWEEGKGGEKCGGAKLISFKGRPQDLTPRARFKALMGWVFMCILCSLRVILLSNERTVRYTPPFDRHDWVVDRCGTRIRYVIDFYTGRPAPGTSNVSFFLDVRPALDNWEGVKMRTTRFFDRWTGSITQSLFGPSESSTPPKQSS